MLTYRGGQAGPRGLALLNGEYLLAAQQGKNYICAWELQRKVRGLSIRGGRGTAAWTGRAGVRVTLPGVLCDAGVLAGLVQRRPEISARVLR